MSKEDYKKLQKEIEDIELDNSLPDYHAFIYWFIETSFGYPKIPVLIAGNATAGLLNQF